MQIPSLNNTTNIERAWIRFQLDTVWLSYKSKNWKLLNILGSKKHICKFLRLILPAGFPLIKETINKRPLSTKVNVAHIHFKITSIYWDLIEQFSPRSRVELKNIYNLHKSSYCSKYLWSVWTVDKRCGHEIQMRIEIANDAF